MLEFFICVELHVLDPNSNRCVPTCRRTCVSCQSSWSLYFPYVLPQQWRELSTCGLLVACSWSTGVGTGLLLGCPPSSTDGLCTLVTAAPSPYDRRFNLDRIWVEWTRYCTTTLSFPPSTSGIVLNAVLEKYYYTEFICHLTVIELRLQKESQH